MLKTQAFEWYEHSEQQNAKNKKKNHMVYEFWYKPCIENITWGTNLWENKCLNYKEHLGIWKIDIFY